MEWIDITVTIRDGMVHWPGDEPVRVERTQDLESGGPYNLSRIIMGLHAGTHMDAPLHFLREGKGIDELPFSATVGPARVIEILDPAAIKPSELEAHDISAGERILFKTRNSKNLWKTDHFVEDFVYITREAAQLLAEKAVRCVGIDYLSVGGFFQDAQETHQALLHEGIWIIEGLDLSTVEPGDYELLCLPLKVARGDGAPARAILKPLR